MPRRTPSPTTLPPVSATWAGWPSVAVLAMAIGDAAEAGYRDITVTMSMQTYADTKAHEGRWSAITSAILDSAVIAPAMPRGQWRVDAR